MALGVLKRSRHSGNSVDLFEFVHGDGVDDVFRYTNAERPLTLGGKTYQPVAIERDGFKKKGREMGSNFKVKVPRSTDLAKLFQGTPPRRVVFLRIYEGDIPEFDSPADWSSEPVADIIWSGRILEAQHQGETTTLSCDNLGAGMKRPGLQRFYTRECPHVLYGTRCQADKVAATRQMMVNNYDPTGRYIPLSANWVTGSEGDNYIGGLVEWNGPKGRESRVIVGTSGTGLTVDSPVVGLLFEGDVIDVVLGCARNLEACATLHNNIINYGGMPYIPTENPHGKNNHT